MATRSVRLTHLHGGLGVVTSGVPLLLGQLEQLLEALLHVAVAAAHQRQLLELPHLGHPAAVSLSEHNLHTTAQHSTAQRSGRTIYSEHLGVPLHTCAARIPGTVNFSYISSV